MAVKKRQRKKRERWKERTNEGESVWDVVVGGVCRAVREHGDVVNVPTRTSRFVYFMSLSLSVLM